MVSFDACSILIKAAPEEQVIRFCEQGTGVLEGIVSQVTKLMMLEQDLGLVL